MVRYEFPKSAGELTKRQLVGIVEQLQYWLFEKEVEHNGEIRRIWNPDIDVNGSEFVEEVVLLLDRHGLVPTTRLDPRDPKSWRPKR